MSKGNFLSGTLDLLILRALDGCPLHGYAIGKWIRATSEGTLEVEEGALYPALHRLERKGLIDGSWGHTETNRRARFYEICAAGRAHLENETALWREYARGVAAVLSGEPGT